MGWLHVLNFSTIQPSWPAGESFSAERDRLGFGRLDLEVAVLVAQEVREPAQPLLLDVGHRRLLLLRHLAEGDEADRGRVHMDADDVIGIDPPEVGGDERAVVAALGAVPLVAEPRHELGQRRGHAPRPPALVTQRRGVAEARQRRHHDVERRGVGRAVAARVGERVDDVEELDEGSGPAVEQQQRRGVRLGRTDVEEVVLLPVDHRGELRVPVDAGLLGPPVEPGSPVLGQLAQVRHGNSLGPLGARQGVRPPGVGQPRVQVVEGGLGNLDAERPDGRVGHRCAS